MQVMKAIETMLAVRSYSGKPIADETVTRIVQAGRLTASAMNQQAWDFVVIRDHDTLCRLGELATTGRYIAGAQFAVAVVVPDSPIGIIDGTRASQDMMLAAWEEGVGSNWVGNVNNEAIKKLLNIPVERMLLTVIPFGYPDRAIGAGRKNRKPLNSVAHRERYGQPYTG
jgi:nitroreductase